MKSWVKIKIFRALHGFAIDTQFLGGIAPMNHKFSKHQFLVHGLKAPAMGPFTKNVIYSEKFCSNPNWTPPTEENWVSVEEMRKLIQNACYMLEDWRHGAPQDLPLYKCWPNCTNLLQ